MRLMGDCPHCKQKIDLNLLQAHMIECRKKQTEPKEQEKKDDKQSEGTNYKPPQALTL